MYSPEHDAAQALKNIPFFSQLSEHEANALAKRMIVRQFGAGQIIFHLGDPGGLLYIISQGKVKITVTNPDGQEALLAILGAGDFFGELALLDAAPRSATAVASEPSVTLTLHREEFVRFLKDNPDFAMHVLSVMAKRIRQLDDQLSDTFFLDLRGRLARKLLDLADQHGRELDDGTLIDLSLTQTELAEMTGATRVSINKTLGGFRDAGWVQVKGRRYAVRDREALENLIFLSGG